LPTVLKTFAVRVAVLARLGRCCQFELLVNADASLTVNALTGLLQNSMRPGKRENC
jgi:hypothetical protein